MKNKNKNKNNLARRFLAYTVIVVVIFVLIIVRVGYIQIVKGEEYKDIAENRSITEIVETAARGDVLDRNGEILAEDKASYSLIYRETKDSSNNFYSIMDLVFKTLEEYGETLDDDFELKVNSANQQEANAETGFYFDFGTTNADSIRYRELRFKKDRGMDSKVAKEIYNKDIGELTEDEETIVDEELLKITPEDTFQYLIELYKIDSKSDLDLDSLSNDEIRKYVLIKDKLWIAALSANSDITIAKNIKKTTALNISQKGLPVDNSDETGIDTEIITTIPGINVSIELYRSYPNNELGSAVLGYLSKINPEQKDKYEEKGYNANTDYVGVSGIEGAFEQYLKGDKSWTIAEVNKQGVTVSEKLTKQSQPGDNVQLTIDSDLQAVAEKALDEVMISQQEEKLHGDVDTTNATRGAAVVIDVNTGEILALVSRPGYDPNVFSQVGDLTAELQQEYFSPDLSIFGEEYVTELLARSSDARATFEGLEVSEIVDKLFPLDDSIENNTTIREDRYDIHAKPLFNYATKSLIPPGSTFKPLMAVAALEEGVVNSTEKIYDPGYYEVGDTKLGSLHPGQSFNIMTALMKSNNHYFYEMGSRLYEKASNEDVLNSGFDSIANYAWQFGLGVPQTEDPYTGIEISEKFGQVYNYESNKRIQTALYMDSLYNYYLITGTNDAPSVKDKIKGVPYYNPIDLNVNLDDSDEVIEIKEDIEDYLIETMQLEFDEYKEREKVFSTQVGEMLMNLLDADDELKNNYEDEEIEDEIVSIIDAMAKSISSSRSQIFSGKVNLISASIGQGINQFTPLQIAMYTATLANGGTRYSANIVDKIIDSDGNIVKDYTPEVINTIDISDSTLNTVKAGMKLVIDNTSGTAYSAFEGFPITSAGKTGSATFATYQEKIGRTAYGVYMGFAPYDNPEIAICVAVFDGGHGGEVAGVARAVYEEYFKEELKTNYPNYVPQNTINVDGGNTSLESTEQLETAVTDQIEEDAEQND
ncbi:penicillin-binding transpeptidase domain-containing protein [Clostridium sp. DL1XJH146]